MRNLQKYLGLAAAAAVVASLQPMTFAIAGSPAISVAVPSPGGGGGGLAGCYRVNHTIYGPYRLSFCLNYGRGSNYTVTGGGLNCNGALDWYDQNNGRIEIDLSRARCGSGTDWTGDSMSCRIGGWRPLVQGGVKGAVVGAIAGAVGVPAPAVPAYNQLNCTYNPAAGGYAPMSVTASRI